MYFKECGRRVGHLEDLGHFGAAVGLRRGVRFQRFEGSKKRGFGLYDRARNAQAGEEKP